MLYLLYSFDDTLAYSWASISIVCICNIVRNIKQTKCNEDDNNTPQFKQIQEINYNGILQCATFSAVCVFLLSASVENCSSYY